MTMAAPAMLVFKGEKQPRYVDLTAGNGKGCLQLGRFNAEQPPDVHLRGLTTSAKHAQIKFEHGRVMIKDSSTNGTFLDGRRIERNAWYILEPSQKIRFGSDEISVNGQQFDVATVKVNKVAKSLAPRASVAESPQVSIGPQPPSDQLPRAARPPSAQPQASMGPEPRVPMGPELPLLETRASGGGSSGSGARVPMGPALPPTNGRRSVAMGPQRPEHSESADSRGVKRKHEAGGKQETCDKCDGKHPTDKCPHFKKTRDNHKDAWQNYGQKNPLSMGRASQRFILRDGRVVRQPGDGSCLFHSLCFGLRNGVQAQGLRRELMTWMSRNQRVEIAGDTMEEWIKWDARSTVTQYTRRMSVSGWGGGIEMAACSIMYNINVHVYECRRQGEFERISCFDAPKKTGKTIHVLYKGGMHFDAIAVR